MSTTKLKTTSASEYPLDQHADKERKLQRVERECYRHKQNSLNLTQKVELLEKKQVSLEKDLDDKTQELEIFRSEIAKKSTALLLAEQKMEHLKENNFITSIFQQILTFISTVIIAIGSAFISTNVGIILFLVGIFAFAASFLPIFLDLRKYLKSRKRNP